MSTILAIEDDQWLGDCYAQWLGSAGHKVVRAADVGSALDILDNTLIDVILLDLFLPQANGIQLIGTLASHSDLARIPILVCSSAVSERGAALLAYGVVAVLDKTTLTQDQLLQTVKEAVHATV